jgi:virulence factor lipase-like protein
MNIGRTTMRTFKKVFSLSVMAMAIQACGGGSDSVGPELKPTPPVTSSKALFNPALGGDGLPFPADLFFASTADGSVNIPGKPSSFNPADLTGTPGDIALIAAATSTPAAPFMADPQTTLNTMDGFSTTGVMVVRFSDAVDDPSDPLDLSQNVRIFRSTSFDPGANGAIDVSALGSELIWGVDFVAGVSSGTSLLIQPLKPLASSTTYIVVIQKGLKTTGGQPVSSDDTYTLVNGSFQLAAGVGAIGASPDFILQAADGMSCDFNSPASVADCTLVNPVYAGVAANPATPAPVAASAGLIAGTLASFEAAMDYGTLYLAEQLRRITAKHLGALAAASSPVDPANVALSYSVSTENIGAALAQAKGQVDAAPAPSINVLNPVASWDGPGVGLPWEIVSPGADGDLATPADAQAHIYLGTLDDIVQFADPALANSSVWEADNASWLGGVSPTCAAFAAHNIGGTKNLVGCNQFTPAAKVAAHSIPVMISAPSAALLAGACSGGNLPVVIYQHGITTSRSTLLAIADTLASACTVGVAIDMPKHGILPANDPFGAEQLAQLQQAMQQTPFAAMDTATPTLERLVEVVSPLTECQDGSRAEAIGNGNFYCPSGDNFINLTNLANSRDTLRQSVIDLHSLYRALTVNGAANLGAAQIGTTIDTGNIHFVGMSLGGIVGATFVANEPTLATATFNVTGGGIAKILDGSPNFEPSITAGLFSAAGLAKPSGSYEGFLIIAQTLIDSMDPMNFTDALAGTGTPVLVQEITGNPADTFTCVANAEGCSDLVVPNNVFGSSFGPAWGLVSGTGQTSFLAKQNQITTPVALSGTDAWAQGTGFIAIASAAQAGAPINPMQLGPLGADVVVTPATSFKGVGLKSVTGCGAAEGGVVRFVSGDHGSLLSPAVDPGVTVLMQTQVAGFIGSAGTYVAPDASGTLVFNAPAGLSTAACAPTP